MFTLDQIVPWGRSFDEYRQMLSISEADLQGRILGCGDGPASFNAVATRRGARVISCDPVYRWDRSQIRQRIDITLPRILEEARRNAGQFVWEAIASVDDLGRIRMAAMDAFLADFREGAVQGRYVPGELPALPFLDDSFDLALCSHLLFLYSRQLDEAFHQRAVDDLCRVASEVRIFPLLSLDGAPSPYVDAIVERLQDRRRTVTIEDVRYEFQRGGNKMLRIRR